MDDNTLYVEGLVRLALILYTGPLDTWRRLTSSLEQSEGKQFDFESTLFDATWWTSSAARQSLDVWISQRSLTKASLSGFLPQGFAQTAIGGASRPLRPVAPVPWQWHCFCEESVLGF